MTFQIQRYEKNVFEFRFEFPILNLKWEAYFASNVQAWTKCLML